MNVGFIASSNPNVTIAIVPLMTGVDDGECIRDKAGSSGNGDEVSVGKG